MLHADTREISYNPQLVASVHVEISNKKVKGLICDRLRGCVGDGPSYITNKHVTTFRALFRHEMEALLEQAGFTDIQVNKVNGWLWENVYSAQRPM